VKYDEKYEWAFMNMNHDTSISPLLVRGGKQLPKNGLDRLLIRGTNWIGDAVMTLPALASIRKTWPGARISILAKPWVADVYRFCPHIDEIVVFESPGRHDGIMGKIRLAKDLQKQSFDGAILLQNAVEAAIIARLARIPLRAGFNSDGRGDRKSTRLNSSHQCGPQVSRMPSSA
jgi:heptosyltransferase-2